MAFVTVEGSGADNTIIQWGDTADTKGPRGQPIGTKFSATFAVDSPYFIAKNITFKVNSSHLQIIFFIVTIMYSHCFFQDLPIYLELFPS